MIEIFVKLPIFKRLIPSIYKKYIFFTKKYFKEIIVDGIIYDLDLRHFIDRRFFFHKVYEQELFSPMLKIINNNNIDYFFDIGSCWGVYSLRLSNIKKHLNILAFEPISKNITRLKNSINKNNIKNIKVFHTAIGSNKGMIELGATENYSPNYKINEKKSVIVEKSKIDSLDNLFSVTNKQIILKIDTEGFELSVLKGADSLLRNNKCYCQIEIISNYKKEIFEFLKVRNYECISINKKNKMDYIFSNFITEKIEI
tara:strand:- start:578 stop:1345 length:768 start_codon:yes stop_codon:yes gene_type:complete